jgi:hypothetical protein
MTEAIEQQPAAGATDAPGATSPVPTDEHAGQQVALQDDADALDLLDADYGDDEGEGADDVGDVGEGERIDSSPQYDLQDFTYAPPAGSHITEIGQTRISAFAEFAHKSNMAPEAFEGAINWYNGLAAQEQARQVETDKSARTDLVAGLKDELGSGYTTFQREVDGAFKELPKELRTALRTARLPSGELLLSRPDAVRMIHRLAVQESRSGQQQGNRTDMLKAELEELNALRDSDIGAFMHKPWKGTGISGSDRSYQIVKELANEAPARASAADLRSEERELIKLRDRDFDMFRFGDWRGTGRPASERLVAIQTGRG